jgi:hypothetical protein
MASVTLSRSSKWSGATQRAQVVLHPFGELRSKLRKLVLQRGVPLLREFQVGEELPLERLL